MTDLVERARGLINEHPAFYSCSLVNDLADEIEHLAAHLDQANQLDVARIREIERLRFVCRDQAGVELSEENDRLIDENKCLRELVKKLSSIGVPGF